MPRSGLADWLSRLEKFSPHEIVLGLDRVKEVLERLDLTLPKQVLHIAGTNGKGSSVAMAASLLAAAGARVGSYTSPHILRYNERIAVNCLPAADAEIVAAFERIEAVRNDVPLTYFEYGTLAALCVFEQNKVEIAILEIGMGGRLDAVNAVEPDAGLITSIALDHCEWLGDTLEAIAREKAGIMRGGKPVIYASTDVANTIIDRAAATGADLVLVERDYSWQEDHSGWQWQGRSLRLDGLVQPALKGPVQLQNAAGVLALLEAAGFDDILTRETVNDALGSVSVLGRMQSVATDRHWLVDVAHNPAAADAMAKALCAIPAEGRTIAIVGMLNDKDVEGLVAPLQPIVDKWIAVEAASPRAITVNELARRIANAGDCACLEAASMAEALDHARRLSSISDRILVTGSFYIVGPALETLGLYSPR